MTPKTTLGGGWGEAKLQTPNIVEIIEVWKKLNSTFAQTWKSVFKANRFFTYWEKIHKEWSLAVCNHGRS